MSQQQSTSTQDVEPKTVTLRQAWLESKGEVLAVAGCTVALGILALGCAAAGEYSKAAALVVATGVCGGLGTLALRL